MAKSLTNVQKNNKYINEQILNRRDHCLKDELPYPKKAKSSIKSGNVLAINNGALIFNTLDENQLALLRKEKV